MNIIIKIGGSIFTDKSSSRSKINQHVIRLFAEELQPFTHIHNMSIVLGGGGVAHHMAEKYRLHLPGKKSLWQKQGSAMLQQMISLQAEKVSRCFAEYGLDTTVYATEEYIEQSRGNVSRVVGDSFSSSRTIPIIPATMVSDTYWDVSICSGDTISAVLASVLDASCIAFATDVDGVYSKDPYIYADAYHLQQLSVREVERGGGVYCSGSHHVDVTGGLKQKIASLTPWLSKKEGRVACIFDGRSREAIQSFLNERAPFPGTTVCW